MTCKSRGSVRHASIMGWEQGCTSEEEEEGVGWLWQLTAGIGGEWWDGVGRRGSVSSRLLPKQMEDNPISCDSIKTPSWMQGH